MFKSCSRIPDAVMEDPVGARLIFNAETSNALAVDVNRSLLEAKSWKLTPRGLQTLKLPSSIPILPASKTVCVGPEAHRSTSVGELDAPKTIEACLNTTELNISFSGPVCGVAEESIGPMFASVADRAEIFDC